MLDEGTLGAISTVLVAIVFLGVCLWAFSPSMRKRFEEDAKLPFADEPEKEHEKNDDRKTDHPEGRN